MLKNTQAVYIFHLLFTKVTNNNYSEPTKALVFNTTIERLSTWKGLLIIPNQPKAKHILFHDLTMIQRDFLIPVSTKRDAGQMDSGNPMEDKSSFPAAGREETGGSKLGRSEEAPKQRSSRCPCRLRSTQLHRAQALTVSLKITDTVRNFCQT